MGIFGKSDSKPPEPAPTRPGLGPAAPAAVPAAPVSSAAPRGATGACVIGPKTVIKGEITGDEDVIVEGTVEGQVRIKSDLRVGAGGRVLATIEAQSVIVSGEVVGDCSAAQRVELQATGRLTGNIRAPRIVIAEGALFKGNSDMAPRKDERKDERKDKPAS